MNWSCQSVMHLSTAILCVFALSELVSCSPNLVEDYAKPIATSQPLDDVKSCLLGSEGCEPLYPPEHTPESELPRFIGGHWVPSDKLPENNN